MAGTLHVAAAAGATVTVVCATRGERGEDFSPVATTQLGARRSAELAASCAAMGVQARWLDLPDGGLASLPPGRLEAALCEALAALAALAPQAVLSLGPDGAYGHQDHLALTSALTSALPRLLCDPRLLHVVFPPRPLRAAMAPDDAGREPHTRVGRGARAGNARGRRRPARRRASAARGQARDDRGALIAAARWPPPQPLPSGRRGGVADGGALSPRCGAPVAGRRRRSARRPRLAARTHLLAPTGPWQHNERYARSSTALQCAPRSGHRGAARRGLRRRR